MKSGAGHDMSAPVLPRRAAARRARAPRRRRTRQKTAARRLMLPRAQMRVRRRRRRALRRRRRRHRTPPLRAACAPTAPRSPRPPPRASPTCWTRAAGAAAEGGAASVRGVPCSSDAMTRRGTHPTQQRGQLRAVRGADLADGGGGAGAGVGRGAGCERRGSAGVRPLFVAAARASALPHFQAASAGGLAACRRPPWPPWEREGADVARTVPAQKGIRQRSSPANGAHRAPSADGRAPASPRSV